MASIKIVEHGNGASHRMFPVIEVHGRHFAEISVDDHRGRHSINFVGLSLNGEHASFSLRSDGSISAASTDLTFESRSAALAHLTAWFSEHGISA